MFLSLFSFPAIVRSPICFPYLLSSPLSHIYPPLSHISFPHPYLISSLSPISYLPCPLSHIFPPLSHIFPSLSHIFPSLSHIFPSLSHISFPLLPYLLSPPFLSSPISFPLLPYLLSLLPYLLSPPPLSLFLPSPIYPLFSPVSPFLSFLPIPSHQDGFVVLPGGTSRPRWCNAQECMERPMSVYTFARPSPASSAVSLLSGVGGPPDRARAYILTDCKQLRKESEQIFIRSLFFQKKKYKKSLW